MQSCSSALSEGVKSFDGYLDDGIKGQSLSANPVTREMASHLDMQDSKDKEVLPKKSATGKPFPASRLHRGCKKKKGPGCVNPTT